MGCWQSREESILGAIQNSERGIIYNDGVGSLQLKMMSGEIHWRGISPLLTKRTATWHLVSLAGLIP